MTKKDFIDLIKKRWYFYVSIIVIIILLVSSLFSCRFKEYKFIATFGDEPQIRVLLCQDVDTFELKIESDFEVYSFYKYSTDSGKKKFSNPPVSSIMVKPKGADIQIGLKTIHSKAIKIEPHKDGTIYVNGVGYRGKLHIFNIGEKLTVVNVLRMEKYIAGIAEMPQRWNIEALYAQAIAARTYAMFKIKKIASKGIYDVWATVKDQCYKGLEVETWRTRRIASFTRGLVLVYPANDWEIFPAFYHSTCGGETIPANSVWKDTPDVLPLSGGKCEFCQASPKFRWKKILTKKEIEERLKKSAIKVGAIKEIELKKFPTDRVKNLEIIHSEGKLKLSAFNFRRVLGTQDFPSTYFSVQDLGERIEFSGRGFGHGVGMCQYGAYGMAKKGYSVEQILSYYYPASEIVRIYK